MTDEQKKLLYKDLCARLPYKVFITIMADNGEMTKDILRPYTLNIFNGRDEIKPYLRPLESMTEKEKKEYWKHGGIEQFDYLNSIHVDYRDLIPKGLALPAKEGMYNFD